MTRTAPEQFQEQSDDEYAILSIIPKGYDLSDPKNIEIFSKRLRQSRKNYFKRMSDLLNPPSYAYKGRREISQRFLAKHLRVSIQEISYYERGRIKKIPRKKLRRIYEFLDVTPHYLLGLVQEPYEMLSLEKMVNTA